MGDTAITAIATIAGAIIGAVIAGPVSYIFSKRLVEQTNVHNLKTLKLTEFNNAAAAFRAAFVDVRLRLRENSKTGDELMSHIITRDIWVNHEKAKILFEPFLSVDELTGFNSQWGKYQNWQTDYFQRDETYHKENPGRKDESQYCLDQIESLLTYAKPKT